MAVGPRRAGDPSRLLSLTERTAWRVADAFVRRLGFLGFAWSYFPMGLLLWLGLCRRMRVHGLALARQLPRGEPVIFVANHRSFFDLFALVMVLRFRAGCRHRLLFPVRSEFFYDHPAGPLLNLLVSGMSMFPPLFRTGRKRALNERAIARCIAELERPWTALGLHPEGTRGRGPEPHRLLPARGGIGRIILGAKQAHVVPVFILGLGDSVLAELWRNWLAASAHPVRVAFGPEVELADLREAVGRADAAQRAADRCVAAITRVAEEVRRISGEGEGM